MKLQKFPQTHLIRFIDINPIRVFCFFPLQYNAHGLSPKNPKSLRTAHFFRHILQIWLTKDTTNHFNLP